MSSFRTYPFALLPLSHSNLKLHCTVPEAEQLVIRATCDAKHGNRAAASFLVFVLPLPRVLSEGHRRRLHALVEPLVASAVRSSFPSHPTW